MTELHLLCREYHFKGEPDMGRWLPIGKVILRLRVDDGEWAFDRDQSMNKINKAIDRLKIIGVKYEILKIFKLPHPTISIQDVYDQITNEIL